MARTKLSCTVRMPRRRAGWPDCMAGFIGSHHRRADLVASGPEILATGAGTNCFQSIAARRGRRPCRDRLFVNWGVIAWVERGRFSEDARSRQAWRQWMRRHRRHVGVCVVSPVLAWPVSVIRGLESIARVSAGAQSGFSRARAASCGWGRRSPPTGRDTRPLPPRQADGRWAPSAPVARSPNFPRGAQILYISCTARRPAVHLECLGC
jgi:hypothetical protein